MANGRGGARVGAGRKTYLEETTKRELVRLCAAKIIIALRSPKISEKDKAHIALEIAKRSFPNVTEEIGNIAKNIIFNITKNHVPNISTHEQQQDRNVDVRDVLHTEADDSA